MIEEKKIQFICYADDIVMIGESSLDVEEATKDVEYRLKMSQLLLNPQKTKFTNGPTTGDYKSWADANGGTWEFQSPQIQTS